MSSQVRQYYCCVCGENFGLCDEYKSHELQHEKLGELNCTECHRTYAELDRFRNHSCDPDVDASTNGLDLKPEMESCVSFGNGSAMEVGDGAGMGSVSEQESLGSSHDAGKHLGNSYDALVSQFVEAEDMGQGMNEQM
jgi:hypothetical protein